MQCALESNLFCRTWYLSTSGNVEPELRRHLVDITVRDHLTVEETKRYTLPPILVAELPQGDVLGEVALYKKLGRIAKENLQTHGKEYWIDTLKGFRVTMGGYWLAWWKTYWESPSFSENIRRGQWWVVIIKVGNRVLWPAVVLLFSFMGVAWLWWRKDDSAWPVTLLLVGAMVSLLTVITLLEGSPRLRQAYDGFFYLAMMCGVGVVFNGNFGKYKFFGHHTNSAGKGYSEPPKSGR